MKILSNDYFSNTSLTPGISSGGPVRFAYELSEFLTSRGHEWIGITNYAEIDTAFSIKKIRTSKSKQFFHASYDKNLITAVLSARKSVDVETVFEVVIVGIERFIRRTRPDVVFLNGYGLFSWVLLRAARNCGVPIVMMHAGIWQKEVEIYSDYFTQRGRGYALEMERQISSCATTEIFLNEFSRDYYNARVVRTPQSRAIIIPLPSHSVLHTKKTADTSGPVRIGIVARWDRIKNHAAVLALAEEIKKQKLPWQIYSVTRIPSSNIKIQLKNKYRKMVTVVDPMDSSALNAFIQSMNMMILPSCFDVSPGVVLEAAQLGKVTIISPTVGFIKEYQACGLRSAVCSFEEPSLVVSRIKSLYKKTFTAELKKLVFGHSSEKIYKQYERVLIDAIKKPRI